MYSTEGPSSIFLTICFSQILSKSVLLILKLKMRGAFTRHADQKLTAHEKKSDFKQQPLWADVVLQALANLRPELLFYYQQYLKNRNTIYLHHSC